ncbi:MAG: hypothetical protein Q8K75_06140 [Chlamydiales bacterium]|nr:hypothetical protein [Chlamydiales bacterium]
MSDTISRVGSNNPLPLQTYPIQSKAKPISDGRIEAKVKALQELWSHFEENRSSIIYGDILSGVKELDGLLHHVPHGEAHDFAFACRLSLQEHPLPSLPVSHRGQVLQLLTEQEGLELHNVRGDGNCGIHAALAAIDPALDTMETVHLTRGDMVAELKKACYDEIDNHWEAVLRNQTSLIPTLGEHHGDKKIARKLVDSYCARMAKDSAWIGERELPFLGKVLGVTIKVYDPYKLGVDRANRKLTFNDSMMAYGTSNNCISIFHDTSHYQALRPRG